VRRLAEAARKDLRARVTELMDEERARFLTVLDELDIDTAGVERLREAARKVDDLRAAEKRAPVSAPRSSG
jgi:hypothetical protein